VTRNSSLGSLKCARIIRGLTMVLLAKAIPNCIFVKRQRAGRFFRSKLPKNKQHFPVFFGYRSWLKSRFYVVRVLFIDLS
jgi:hypothetical protein